ncbi:MAG: hypothetical protein EXX96DRAFT_487919, partial [Benjaminiella poitrasii]
YARKSPTGEDITCRTRLLKPMISNYKERSFATKIFVSPCSLASLPLISRDLLGNPQVIVDELSVDGNTQYLKPVHHDAYLVIIDFTGITTRSEDIDNLVEANPFLKKIAVETFAQCKEVFIFDTKRLVKDNGLLLYSHLYLVSYIRSINNNYLIVYSLIHSSYKLPYNKALGHLLV